MNTAERKALEFLAGREGLTPTFSIPNGRGYTGTRHATEKTMISIEESGWAVWEIRVENHGWRITEAGRAALAEKEPQR